MFLLPFAITMNGDDTSNVDDVDDIVVSGLTAVTLLTVIMHSLATVAWNSPLIRPPTQHRPSTQSPPVQHHTMPLQNWMDPSLLMVFDRILFCMVVLSVLVQHRSTHTRVPAIFTAIFFRWTWVTSLPSWSWSTSGQSVINCLMIVPTLFDWSM